MPGAPEHGGASDEIQHILDGIEGLSPAARERLYVRLLYRSPPHSAPRLLAGEASDPDNPKIRRYLAEPGRAAVEASDTIRPTDREPSSAASRSPAVGTAGQMRSASRSGVLTGSVIRLELVDLHGGFSFMMGQPLRQIERHLQNLDAWAGHLNLISKHNISFALSLRSREPSVKEKASLPPRLFPFYIVDESRTGFETVLRIINEHGYPVMVPGSNVSARDYAERSWRTPILGVTMPAFGADKSRRFLKCIFLKGREIERHAHGNSAYVSNVILHEFGHACGIFSQRTNPHPKDASAMQSGVPPAQLMMGLRPYNQRHAQIVLSMMATLSRVSLVLLLVALAACGRGHPSSPAPCAVDSSSQGSCATCGAPSTLAPTARDALAQRLLTTILRKDSVASTFGLRSADPVYLMVDGHDWRFDGVPTVGRADELDPRLRQHPDTPVTILQLKVLGASGVDSIYLEATVIERFWSSGYGRIWQDLAIGTYCLRRRGDAVIVTSVSPPIYLN